MKPLITAAALQALPDALILDWRFDLTDAQAGQRAYAAGHIPGAFYVHLDEVCAPKTGSNGRHPLPDRAGFAARMAGLGLRGGRPVVCYDAANSMFAARGWWMLQWIGHAEVAVLDGGLAAWPGALSTEQPVPQPGDFRLGPSLVEQVDAQALSAQLGRVALIDARAPERFRGEVEPLDRQAGHIPGARNRPFAANLQADGRFKPAAQLQAEWAPYAPQVDTVHQCGSGVSACHNLLALAAAGLAVGRLYPGSWSEWSADPDRPDRPDRPVAKGG
jgi:thiosulfate/3-mercaptopyruvate sulfurtransferase